MGLGIAAGGRAQTTPAAADAQALEQRIQRIQDGLLPPVVVKGEPAGTTTLSVRMAEMHVPGVSIAVIHGGRLEWARGFGVTAVGGAPVTPDTLFQAASISKPVTAMAVLHLVQTGSLDLDADANQYLKAWKIPANGFTEQRKVTLRELLSHTAGMTVHGFAGYAADSPVPTLVQVLDGAAPANSAPIRVEAVPGKAWKYSGGGYVVVQQILGDVTGRPFPGLMQETVLGPVGMARSTYEQPLPQDRRAEAATPYTWKGEAVPGGPHTYPEMAPAGLWTTPTDLARFAIEIQESLAGKSNRVLSASMTREMLTGALGGDYGLGLGIGGGAGHRYFSHGGSNEGYQCLLTAYEDGDGAVIMTNGDAGGALAQQIIRTIAAEYGWPDFRPAERAVAAVDPKSFDSLVGVYRLSPGTICAITREGDRLFTQITGQPSFRLFPMSEREFFLTVVDARVTFPPDVEGRAPELIIHQNGHEAHAKRLSDAESQSIAERRAATEKPAPAPAWKLRDLDGNLVSSEQFKGKVLVVDFWATWCAGCVSEMPGYESLQGKYAKEGVVFVGISMDGDAGVAKKFIAKHGITYQIVMADKDVAPAFGVDSMPGTFIVNRDGMIVDRKTGVVVETPDFEKALLKVLKPTAPGS